MGICRFCRTDAGFLRKQHKECREKHDLALTKIPSFFVQALQSELDADRFKNLLREIADENFIQDNKLHELAVKGVGLLVETALNDRLLTDDESARIRELAATFSISANDLGVAGTKLVKAEVLRDLDAGRIPNRIKLEGNLVPNLERGESVIFAFNNVEFHTVRSRTHYEGGSQGVSVRLARGVYYRIGASKGQAVRKEYLSKEAIGGLIIGNRNIYFMAPNKALKIPSKKIVSVQLYSDSITVVRDGAKPRPHIFILDDPPFAANLIARLNDL